MSRGETTNATFELYTMSDSGADLKRLTTNLVTEWAPALAPDTNRIAYVNPGLARSNIFIAALAGGAPIVVGNTNRAVCVQWLSNSNLFYLMTTNVPGGEAFYELWRIDTNGANQQRVFTNRFRVWYTGVDRFHIDRDRGRVHLSSVYASDTCKLISGLVTATAPDTVLSTCVTNWDHYDPAVSPDGQKIAYSADNNEGPPYTLIGRHRLYTNGIAGGCVNPIAPFFTADPVWSPDGQWLAFTYSTIPTWGADSYVGSIYRINAGGTGSTNLSATLPVSNLCAHACVYNEPAVQNPDSNTNGIPDWWELLHFGALTNVTETSDRDGDGFRDKHEYWADTVPTNRKSYLGVEALAGGAGGYVVTWQSVTTKQYALQRTTNLLVQASFSNLAQHILGKQGTTAHTDTTVNASPPYYRIKTEP